MTSVGHRLEGSLDGTLGEISYIFSFVFYGSIEATTEAIHRWFYFSKYRQCIITAPVVLTACLRVWYTKYVFTRLVYQPLAYASGILMKQLLIRGRHQYIDYIVCFNIKDSHYYPNEYTILYIFRAPGSNSLVLLS